MSDHEAEVTLSRTALVNNPLGFLVSDLELSEDAASPPERALTLRDVVIAGADSHRGLATDSGHLTLERTVFDGMVGVAVWAESEADLVLNDVVVRNGRPARR